MIDAERAEAWGVELRYEDAGGTWRQVPEATVGGVLAAMGADQPRPPPSRAWVVLAGEAVHVDGAWELTLEDGTVLDGSGGSLAPDLPLGYHVLRRPGEPAIRVVVSPGRCHLPDDLRTWGWAVQLYALRSRDSWGIGDLADLRRLAGWSRSAGAGMTLVNPLHAAAVVPPVEASPYFASSRCFSNPIYLRVEDVPGAVDARLDLIALSARAKALSGSPRIDRDAVWALKLSALERLWERFRGDSGFDRYCDEQGPALAGFATFCALSEQHQGPWTSWPVGLRGPDSPEVLAFVDEHRGRIRFHQWLQWLVDLQLQVASAEIDLVRDLAVGVDPAGADAWLWSDLFALGVRVGAPPDEFNTQGQDWGLPPFDPWRLRASAYEPYIRVVRAALRHAGGSRIDHVMGLFRLFWIPDGVDPREGTYVRYPWQDLLRILALESHRAGALVVGEDLGTVEPRVREELARARVLSYRLLWFEDEPPSAFPVDALAAVTTHDLPTIAGLWTGADLDELRALDQAPNEESTRALRERLRSITGVAADAPADAVVSAAYALLAQAPSRILTATLDDALGVVERPNIPGTRGERPNWSIGLPALVEEIEVDERVARIAATLDASRAAVG